MVRGGTEGEEERWEEEDEGTVHQECVHRGREREGYEWLYSLIESGRTVY